MAALVVLASACGAPPPDSPSAVIESNPETICLGDDFRTPIELDASASTPRLTLVPVPGIDFFIPGQTQPEAGKGYFVAWTPHAADLEILTGWIEAGQLRPVIDSEFPLEEIRAAHERSQTLRARGKIVIRIKDS